MRRGSSDWIDQFKNSVYVGGSPEDQQEASVLDWVFHFVALPWKLAFAFVPPTCYAGGWFCFSVSLACIGVITGLVSDMAETFGCMLGLRDDVTGILFVALGTS